MCNFGKLARIYLFICLIYLAAIKSFYVTNPPRMRSCTLVGGEVFFVYFRGQLTKSTVLLVAKLPKCNNPVRYRSTPCLV